MGEGGGVITCFGFRSCDGVGGEATTEGTEQLIVSLFFVCEFYRV